MYAKEINLKKTFTEFMSELKHFTGTEKYHKSFLNTRLTDGVNYLAENLECFWLMDDIAIFARPYARLGLLIVEYCNNKKEGTVAKNYSELQKGYFLVLSA
ncbi:DUF6876 family protein [Piscirickettsia salmonis]|uniref:DUF6876 domain-containing protein n=1 Tax=Piscirickettsia salmonis TaxID=1238 RepID=A0A9Q5YKP1_PISSA|nr:DUF6876 family protein [Piscirickettsia salmonis]APS56953.1 hypothetical protein AVI52_06655 [Piscirickettsia salmonis]ERL60982.1 hypothetical protein K661_02695 [Piscirickettsia salmonis LF-89 = ATCC VR-1361]PEQ16195.1 hypothetical protein X973_08760 [Piscirickettsia salmonis]QGN78325.1 hypothetical protein Psal001_02563 [Piscirickettsia salmonis]QGN81908.1 hypothetical protein Psal002_02581 [Piscirickettsia salmonis]